MTRDIGERVGQGHVDHADVDSDAAGLSDNLRSFSPKPMLGQSFEWSINIGRYSFSPFVVNISQLRCVEVGLRVDDNTTTDRESQDLFIE